MFCIDSLGRMNHTRFHFFEPVRFSADVYDLSNPEVSPAQQPKGLLAAGLSFRVRAFCAEMEFIFTQDFAICLYACDASTTVEALRRDLILFSGILVDPGQINPDSCGTRRFQAVQCHQVEIT
jgi:hypothetical protein